MIKKVAILTSGGDSPGMNNAVRAIVKHARAMDIEPFLVMEGYKGLHNGDIRPSTDFDVDFYNSKGGTFIYTSRYPEFKDPKVREEAKEQLVKRGIDALVVIGGDGSYQGAQLLHEIGVKTVALPGTIDNDITSSDFTIGYDTALNTIVQAIEQVRDTMTSHNRAAIFEVMGHGCGDLALYGGIAAAAEIIVTNENKMTPSDMAEVIKEQMIDKGKRSVVAIVSEDIFPDLKAIAKEVTEKSGVVTRSVRLAHVQRGGVPSAQERINAVLMGVKAVELLANGQSGIALGILSGDVKATPILEALEIPRVNRAKLAEKIYKLNQA